MKKINILLLWLTGLLLLAGCDKKELEDYAGPDSIYFDIQRDHFVSFLERSVQKIDTTIRVLTLGEVVPYERTFKLVMDDSCTLVNGEHFEVSLEYKMPAGKAEVALPLTIFRHQDLQQEGKRFRIALRLVESADFNTDFKEISGIDVLQYFLDISDRIDRPAKWTDESSSNYYKYYGKYSLKKMIMLMDVCGKPASFFSSIYNPAIFQATSRGVRLYLEQQDPKIQDEDGALMTMGELAL